jgi:hypothetical protein
VSRDVRVARWCVADRPSDVCCNVSASFSFRSAARASTAASLSRSANPACVSSACTCFLNINPRATYNKDAELALDTRACLSAFNSRFSFSNSRRRSCWLSIVTSDVLSLANDCASASSKLRRTSLRSGRVRRAEQHDRLNIVHLDAQLSRVPPRPRQYAPA